MPHPLLAAALLASTVVGAGPPGQGPTDAVQLVGVVTRQGDLLCDGGYDFKFVNPHHEVGFVRVASASVDLGALEGKPVVVTGTVAAGFVPPPVKHTGECPQVQMRSDWRIGMGGMRVMRGESPPWPAFAVTAARELTSLTVRRTKGELALTFTNPVGVTLTDVKLRVHYEGCYGKPGHQQRDIVRATLPAGGRLSGRLPTLSERPDGPQGRRTHRASSVEVLARGPGVAFDLDIAISKLATRVECPEQERRTKKAPSGP